MFMPTQSNQVPERSFSCQLKSTLSAVRTVKVQFFRYEKYTESVLLSERDYGIEEGLIDIEFSMSSEVKIKGKMRVSEVPM